MFILGRKAIFFESGCNCTKSRFHAKEEGGSGRIFRIKRDTHSGSISCLNPFSSGEMTHSVPFGRGSQRRIAAVTGEEEQTPILQASLCIAQGNNAATSKRCPPFLSACIAGNWRSVQICSPQLASLKDKKPILGYTFFSPPKTSQTCISTHTFPPNLIPPPPFFRNPEYIRRQRLVSLASPRRKSRRKKNHRASVDFRILFSWSSAYPPPQLYSSSCRIINSSSLSPSSSLVVLQAAG